MLILARNWWSLALRGLAAVLLGIAAFVWPGVTLTAIVFLFGAYAFVDGVLAIGGAIAGEEWQGHRWPLVVEGLLGIAVGLITFFWPGVTALALVLVIATWAVLTGIMEIVAAVRLREAISNEWLMIVSGLVSVIFGGLLFVQPAAGALAITWIIGAYALIFGIALIALAFRLRGWQRTHERQLAPA